MSSAFFTDRVNTPDVPEDDPYLILNETTTPRPEFTRHSGSRFYNRARLVTVEELHHPTTRSRVAESRRGPRASDPRDTTSRRSRKGGIRSTSSRESSNPKRSPSRHSSNTSRKSNRTTTTTTNKRKTNDDYRSQSYSSRQTSKTKHGNDDTYDAYPWSAYYRDQVMVLNKFPKPPYFLQLPSGKRPDTIVLRNIPVSWFLDTPEEVKLEKERERRETKVTTYPGNSHHNGEATDVTLEPDSDSPFWFTKHGHIIVKAACMKFGAIRRVDLVFEMESRDEEWSLCFDAYVQFKYFQGFRDCYIAFDGAVLLHHKDDADDYDTTATATTPSTTTQSGQQENRPMQKNKEKQVEALYLVPEFDISEHFSDHQVKLRKVRKEMEEKKRNQEEYLIKRNNLKLKKQYKETVINLHKALKKMNNDMEDVEIYLTRLLDMTSETEAEELKQKEEEKEESKWGSNEAEASSKYNEEYREGKEEHEQRKEGKNKEETWDDATTPAPATRSSNVFIAATEDARECMRTATEYINGLPNTGESTVDIVTGELAGALTLVPAAKKHLSLLNKSIKHANSIIFQEHTIRTVQVPSLLNVLNNDGDVNIMLKKIKQKMAMSGEEYFHGITLFVPSDRGFSRDTIYDESCWGTHIIRGPYQMRDLYDLCNNGPGELLCEDMVNNLSVGLNERGEFVVSINKLGHPQKICRIERQDINVKHGTVVHFIDRVLFPPAF